VINKKLNRKKFKKFNKANSITHETFFFQ